MIVLPETFYKNKKTGNKYFVESVNGIDTTNNFNGKMVLYYALKDNNDENSINFDFFYVRTLEEFENKFIE